MADEYIADVYIDGGKTGALRGVLPSDVIDFRGGYTRVRNQDVLYALLRRADMEIHPSHRYKDSYSTWLGDCPYNHPPQARIVLEDGYVLSPDNGYTRTEIDWDEQDDNPFDGDPEQPKPARTRRLRTVPSSDSQ